MRRRGRGAAFGLVAALLVTSCAGGEGTTERQILVEDDRDEAPADPSPARSSTETAAGVRASARLPHTAGALARELERVDQELKERLDQWVPSKKTRRSEEWHDLLLLGLRAQKIYRKLVTHERLARRVERRVGKTLAWKVHANVRAGRGLRALTTPLEPPIRMKTKRPASPRKLLRFYKAARRRFGIPWPILASLNFVESKFGRLNGPSSAGALGPMQFMPATWDVYGRGDIMDPRDSIMAAARYLRASGAPGRMRDALYAYNHSWAYVDAIQIYARQIKHDTRNYYGYYLYQVFVRTTEGDVQLTGPGSDT